VDAYVDPHPAPTQVNEIWYDGRSAQGIVWGITGAALPMQPGVVITLTFGDQYDGGLPYTFFTGNLRAGTPIWAQVDSYNAATRYGAVLETHEVYGGIYNNIMGPVYSTAGVSGSVSPQSQTPSTDTALPGWDKLPPRPWR
jgi:hypothetical protein